MKSDFPAESLLGKQVSTPASYSPELLFPIARAESRSRFGAGEGELPFQGFDRWQAWELSWLDVEGKPRVGCGIITVPCESPAIIESKSLKLYFNSLNQTRFSSAEALTETVQRDLSAAAGCAISFELTAPEAQAMLAPQPAPGLCLDDLPLADLRYQPDPSRLQSDASQRVEETLHSHLLRSLCPVTGQPDWATVIIDYRGPLIDHAGLLAYLISYREHQDFHEHCVESIFLDLLRACRTERLTVAAQYLRRGGLDISPLRSTHSVPAYPRTLRQ